MGKQTIEKTKGTIKDGQSRDTGNIVNKSKNEDKTTTHRKLKR